MPMTAPASSPATTLPAALDTLREAASLARRARRARPSSSAIGSRRADRRAIAAGRATLDLAAPADVT